MKVESWGVGGHPKLSLVSVSKQELLRDIVFPSNGPYTHEKIFSKFGNCTTSNIHLRVHVVFITILKMKLQYLTMLCVTCIT